MSGVEDLADALTPGLSMSWDTGLVEQVVDAQHLRVDLGGLPVVAFVPSTLVGAAMAGSTVIVARQGQSWLVLDVTVGAWIGSVRMILDGTVRPGWLLLDGSTFSSATYPLLYALLGSTTLPDWRDRFPVGASATKTIRTTGGSSKISTAQLPPHTHAPGAGTNFVNGYQSVTGIQSGSGKTAGDASGTSAATGSTGSGTDYWPRYLAVNYIIKAL